MIGVAVWIWQSVFGGAAPPGTPGALQADMSSTSSEWFFIL